MKRERWIWISGWGLPPDWFRQEAERALPAARHTVIPPAQEAVSRIDWRQFDRVGGYSLGAFLLLRHNDMVTLPTVLIAPFFAFAAEFGLGGRTEQVRVRYLARWLRRDPLKALTDFYSRAQLDLEAPGEMPYAPNELEWGLDQLANERAPTRLPDNWTGFVGDADPFVDADFLAAMEPRLQVIPGAGHHPAPLLASIGPLQ